MKLENGLFAVKLYEMEKQYTLLQSRLLYETKVTSNIQSDVLMAFSPMDTGIVKKLTKVPIASMLIMVRRII